MRFHTFSSLALAIVCLASSQLQAELTIGAKAPALNIEHWLSENKLPKVEKFEPQTVYIVEFWATWCPPCVASMPHLAQLQQDYLNKNVRIISVSNESREDVEEFLQRPVQGRGRKASGDGDDEQTYGQLTSSYSLTTDPDQSVYNDYMEASGEGGIPTAFIVGKSGLIEWIGHPMEMDEPLNQVLDGTWDRQAFGNRRQEQRRVEEGMQEVSNLLQAGRSDKALATLDQLIAQCTDLELKAALSGAKIQVLMEINPDQAAKQILELVDRSNESESLNLIAWQVVELAQSQKSAAPEPLMQAAKLAAEKAIKLSPKDGSPLDTLAHLLQLEGEIQRAIELQKKAIELSPEVPQFKKFLKELENYKPTQNP